MTLEELAQAHEAAWEALMAEALEAASEAVDRLELRDAIDRARPDEIAQVLLLAWLRGGRPVLERLFDEALLALVAAAVPITIDDLPGFAPDLTSAGWLSWLRRYRAERVAWIDELTTQGLREAFREGVTADEPTRTLVEQLRALVGVSPVLWPTVWRYREGLRQARAVPATIEPLVVLRATQLKATRAETIARQETYQAVLATQQQVWQQAAQQGVVPRAQVWWRWVIQPGACRHICEPIPRMNPNGVALEQPFASPIGNLMVPGETHMRCRCRILISIEQEAA